MKSFDIFRKSNLTLNLQFISIANNVCSTLLMPLTCVYHANPFAPNPSAPLHCFPYILSDLHPKIVIYISHQTLCSYFQIKSHVSVSGSVYANVIQSTAPTTTSICTKSYPIQIQCERMLNVFVYYFQYISIESLAFIVLRVIRTSAFVFR